MTIFLQNETRRYLSQWRKTCINSSIYCAWSMSFLKFAFILKWLYCIKNKLWALKTTPKIFLFVLLFNDQGWFQLSDIHSVGVACPWKQQFHPETLTELHQIIGNHLKKQPKLKIRDKENQSSALSS